MLPEMVLSFTVTSLSVLTKMPPPSMATLPAIVQSVSIAGSELPYRQPIPPPQLAELKARVQFLRTTIALAKLQIPPPTTPLPGPLAMFPDRVLLISVALVL